MLISLFKFPWCVTGGMHDVYTKADRYPVCYRSCARCSSPSWSVPCLLQVVCTMFIPKLIGTLLVTGGVHDVHSQADRYPVCYRWCARCSFPSWSVPCLLQVVCVMFIPKLIGTLFVTGRVHDVHPQADRYPVCYRSCAQCSSPSWSVPCLLQVVCVMFIPKLIGTLFVTGRVHDVHSQADRYPVCYRWCARCSFQSWSVPCLLQVVCTMFIPKLIGTLFVTGGV